MMQFTRFHLYVLVFSGRRLVCVDSATGELRIYETIHFSPFADVYQQVRLTLKNEPCSYLCRIVKSHLSIFSIPSALDV